MNSERLSLEDLTLRQLRARAMELDISRYSRMTKDQLLVAIRAAQVSQIGRQPTSPAPQEKDKPASAKFHAGGVHDIARLADVDEKLGDLPGGYGTSRIVLLPRDPQWAYAYWDIPNDHKEDLRRQGGQQLALRVYDVTDIDLNSQVAHSMQEYPCDELAREWYVPIPISDRSYIAEIGYRTWDGRWLVLARSAGVMAPPTYPSDWFEEHFITVPFDMPLHGKTLLQLKAPYQRYGEEAALGAAASASTTTTTTITKDPSITDAFFQMAGGFESMRVAGSLFGSHQMLPEQTLSSFVTPSGVGMLSEERLAGAAVAPWMASGSGLGLFSGSSEVMPQQQRARKFWLVADAELIVYGATEPDATVTIGGRPIKLNPDGTFRFHMAFPDGNIDFPIFAVAADGEQNREVHLTFDRATPAHRTNTKEEAVEELLP
ncbi:MAG: DUF4912 domain-containing protein [Cyanophyceae cyanobacterium]